MKKQLQQDERIVAQTRKIGSDALQITVFGLPVAILVQQYVFHAPFAQYAVELVLFLALAIYIVIRNLLVGNDLFVSKRGGQRMVVVNSLLCGITVSVVNTILNYAQYGDTVQLPIALHTALLVGITLISATVTAFVVLELVYLANKKKQQSMESQFNANE